MEKLIEIFEGFDIEKIGEMLPDPQVLLENLDKLMVFLVMVGPLVMLGLGLFYLFLAPKEANHSVGYRFFYAMSQVQVWQYAQRLAGVVFIALGLALTVIVGLTSFRFGKMVAPDMVWLAVKCMLWELVLTIIATLGINITIMFNFDMKGNRRSDKPQPKFAGKKKKKTAAKK